MLLLAAVLLLTARPQDVDKVSLPAQVEADFQRRWESFEKERKSRDLLDLYALADHSLSNRLAQPEPEVLRWVRLPRVLAPRLAGLPAQALETHEVVARQAIDGVSDPEALRRAIDRYGYTRAASTARMALARRDADEGRDGEALKVLADAFDRDPEPETAAQIAFLHARRGHLPALLALRATLKELRVRGELRVGGRTRALGELVDALVEGLQPRQEPGPAAPPLEAELLLGRYEYLSREASYARELAAAQPALGRVEGRDLVVFTNGWRVVALDPAKGAGGSLEDAVVWRHPRDGSAIRGWTSVNQYNSVPPSVGAVVDGGRVFVTTFTRYEERNQQVGRRSDRSEGPAALRAFDLATGEPLWDTESLESENAQGTRERMVDQTSFSRRNWSFAGPPLVRGDRVYAAVMTSPLTPRFVYVICLDSATGRLHWQAEVAEAPATREQAQLPTLAEAGGLLAVNTNYGVLAVLDAASGRFEWLVKYREVQGMPRPAASPPVFAGGLLFLLAQDWEELLAFDPWTGRPAPIAPPSEKLEWTSYWRLSGPEAGWLLLSGARNAAYRIRDGKTVLFEDAEGEILGRPTLKDGRIFLPSRSGLLVHEAPDWKRVRKLPWTEKQGNLVLAGDWLLFQSDQLAVFGAADRLQARFAEKLHATPPHGPTCRQMAEILEASGRAKESVPYYRLAFRVWEKDAAWQESAEEMRKKLDSLAEKLGDDFPR
jgi:outer membrane protein assembly factor BamB